MKILHITPEAPDVCSGGQQAVLQSARSLSACADRLDYIGPKIKNKKMKNLYNKIIELEPLRDVFHTLGTLLHGETNRRFYAWKRLKVDYSWYDYVFLEFTKMDYVVRDIKRSSPDTKIITRVHNIEMDYAKADFKKHKSLDKLIVALFSERQEKAIADYSDKLFLLLKRDAQRFSKLYSVEKSKICVVPICTDNHLKDHEIGRMHSEPNLLITGSLWFGPNSDGVQWFLDRVFPKIQGCFSLTIAGFHPNDRLKRKCEALAVELIDSPEDISPYFEKCDLFLLPIFEGAGMKVKFAEAMSYGLPIVSTSFGAAGYDTEKTDGCFIADDEELFASSINHFLKLSTEERKKAARSSYEIFKKKYSMESSIKRYRKYLEI